MPRNNYYNNADNDNNNLPFGYTISPTVPADKDTSPVGVPSSIAKTEPEEEIIGRKPTEAMNSEEDFAKTEVDDMISNDAKSGSVAIRPVVGWLVGIKGVCRGADYRLHSGRNYIGRAADLDICLNDVKISRDPAIQIVFDPKSRAFLIGPCDRTSTLSYHNDKVLMGMHELTAYDRIQLGDCELMFVPLCGEHFVWTEE